MREDGEDEECKRCFAADTARKCSARCYTNRNLELLSSLLRCEVEEYNLRHAWRFEAGSYFGAGSRTPLPPSKWEEEELPRFVKREGEELMHSVFPGVVRLEDSSPLKRKQSPR